MTSAHPVRRLLQRLCSADTMSRVVDPTLADIRWESSRPPWLGYLTLARALTVHAVLSIPSVLSRTWSDDGGAIPKSAAYAAAGAILAAALLIAPIAVPLPNVDVRGIAWLRVLLLLLPQALVLTIPAALLLAVPLGLRHQPHSPRLARRTIALSIVCAGLTFALIVWVPSANQSFRVITSGDPAIRPGPNETGLAALREQIETLNLTPGGRVVARRVEYAYQLRLALAFAPLSLGVLGLAVTASPWGKRRPWLIGLAAAAFYVGMFPSLVHSSGLLIRATSLPPLIFAWAPNVLIALTATLLLARFPFRIQPSAFDVQH
jgi:hypothetical protein